MSELLCANPTLDDIARMKQKCASAGFVPKKISMTKSSLQKLIASNSDAVNATRVMTGTRRQTVKRLRYEVMGMEIDVADSGA